MPRFAVRIENREGWRYVDVLPHGYWEGRYFWHTWTIEDDYDAACKTANDLRAGGSRDLRSVRIDPIEDPTS